VAPAPIVRIDEPELLGDTFNNGFELGNPGLFLLNSGLGNPNRSCGSALPIQGLQEIVRMLLSGCEIGLWTYPLIHGPIGQAWSFLT